MEQQFLGDVKVRRRSRLPHWDCAAGLYAVTFNAFDAVPPRMLDQARAEAAAQRDRIRQTRGHETIAEERAIMLWLQRRLMRLADAGHGSCFMNDERVAQVVVDALTHFDGERYSLYALCVMPNHVHVVLSLLGNQVIARVIHSWKSYTSHEANRILAREGPFWMSDYFDRTIRRPAEARRWIGYVTGNPRKAGLIDWPHVRTYPERIAQLM